MAGIVYVTGESALSATLADHTDIASFEALKGGTPAYTASYYTGFQSGSAGGAVTTPPTSSIVVPDNRVYRIVFNA